MDGEVPASEQITAWLTNWREGDAQASEQLFAVVDPLLRRITAGFLRNERGHHTLEPNALVNELCLRLLGSKPIDFKDRAHFFAIAAQTMRRILIDHARARIAEKRGGAQQRLSLSAVEGWNPVAHNEDILTLDQAFVETGKSRSARSPCGRTAILRWFARGRDRRSTARLCHHDGRPLSH